MRLEVVSSTNPTTEDAYCILPHSLKLRRATVAELTEDKSATETRRHRDSLCLCVSVAHSLCALPFLCVDFPHGLLETVSPCPW